MPGVSLPTIKKPPPEVYCQRELTKYEPKPTKALQRYNETAPDPDLPGSFS
jgi:hypothetical protein